MNTYDDAEYWRLRFAEEHSRKMEERRFNRILYRLLVGAFTVVAISMVCVTQAAAADVTMADAKQMLVAQYPDMEVTFKTE